MLARVVASSVMSRRFSLGLLSLVALACASRPASLDDEAADASESDATTTYSASRVPRAKSAWPSRPTITIGSIIKNACPCSLQGQEHIGFCVAA